ncbi:MAG: helix-turn-helix transcriptional regulator [Actinobacteria bacterium]|nr:helix-turn-helix transcriptional regulator [Actinomycetota bacterium]
MPESLRLAYAWGGTATYEPGATFGPRLLEDFELVWILAGHASYIVDRRELDAPPGTILLGRPGFREAYRWDPERVTRHAFVHFAVHELPDDWSPIATWPISRLMAPGDAVRPLFRRVLDEWCDGTRRRARPTRAVARMVEALLDSFLSPAPTTELEVRPAAVSRVLDWLSCSLDNEPARPVSLPELAAAGAVTPKHLCRLFAASVGRSPMETVRLMRLERALVLLARSNLSVQEVGRLSGFSSPNHFSRCFRSVYGSPPLAVRRAVLAGQVPPSTPLTLPR